MKQKTIRLGFTGYSDRSLERKANKILSGMRGNANFPDPAPSIKEVQQQLAEFTASLDARDGRTGNEWLQQRSRSRLEHSLQLIGYYVLHQGATKACVLRSSGFDMVLNTEQIDLLEAPGGFRVKTDGCSMARLSADPVYSAAYYLFQYTDAPLTGDSIWVSESDTQPVHLLEQLTTGKGYCFRMAAADSSGNSVFTEVVSRFIK